MEIDEADGIRPEDIKPYAFISGLALKEKFIGYCYKEHPETKIDSGWKFMHGTEDEEYASKTENSVCIYLEEVLEINPALKEILDSSVHSEFEWDPDSKLYLEI